MAGSGTAARRRRRDVPAGGVPQAGGGGPVLSAIIDTSEDIENHLGTGRRFRSKADEIAFLRGSVAQLQSERDELYGLGSAEYARGRKEALAERQAEFEAALDEFVAMEGRTTDRLQAEVGPWADDLYRRLRSPWPTADEMIKTLTLWVKDLERDLAALDVMAAHVRADDRRAAIARVFEVLDKIRPEYDAKIGNIFLHLLILAHRYGLGLHDAARANHERNLTANWTIGGHQSLMPVLDVEGVRRGSRLVYGQPTCFVCGERALLTANPTTGQDYCGEHVPRCSECGNAEGVLEPSGADQWRCERHPLVEIISQEEVAGVE